MTAVVCRDCGLVEHDLIREDDAHCPCRHDVVCKCECHDDGERQTSG
jgi:hypothetical protein